MGTLSICDTTVVDPSGLSRTAVQREVLDYALRLRLSAEHKAQALSYALTATDTFTAIRIGKERVRTLRARELSHTPDAA